MEAPPPLIAPGYLTTAQAAQRLGVSLNKIQAACRRYRARLAPLAAPTATDLDPLPAEVACSWTGSRQRLTYYVRADLLDRHFVNRGAARKRGRPLADERGIFVPRRLVLAILKGASPCPAHT